ncbi:hypothetical protein [Streptacidiphilus monticola]|uniref:Uncharacterized protein n=1 Tax=Streptacidiphilus monticola TaxID=2161674 RepID=A0ABW1FV12_9ACTN
MTPTSTPLPSTPLASTPLALASRRPVPAETELRGILAGRLRRAEIDDLMHRLFAERDARTAAPPSALPALPALPATGCLLPTLEAGAR